MRLRLPCGSASHNDAVVSLCSAQTCPSGRRRFTPTLSMKYVHELELARWDYEDLQREVSRATGRKGNSLYEMVVLIIRPQKLK
ncbi:MAG: hypothetical protein QNL05_07845 [Gammaproteobacteria bacterium]|nr:hypothetical protein [Gammaproteobacteria bacterium]